MPPTANTDPSYVSVLPGDPAPWFHQDSSIGPNLAFHAMAGRYVVLCFYGSLADKHGRAAIDAVLAHAAQFDDVRASFFGVSTDPGDQSKKRVPSGTAGVRFFWDWDLKVSRLYGAAPRD